MHVAVIADEAGQKEFLDKQIPEGIQVYFINEVEEVNPDVDALFYLKDEVEATKLTKLLGAVYLPVFVNAVIKTLKDLPPSCIRINGWPGFLMNKHVEIAASSTNLSTAQKILGALQWSYINVPDIEGMIAPRTVATIINEAYFALEEQISSKDQIDIAMKLGTNYPYGPFEWAQKIGLRKIFNLLMQLYQTDERYMPAPFLKKEIND